MTDPSITREETQYSIVYKCHGVSFLYIYKTGVISRSPGREVEGGPAVIHSGGDRDWINPNGYLLQCKSRWE